MTISVHEEVLPSVQKEFRVRDGGRMVVFNGVKLSFATSERMDSTRWTEIEIYVTEGGNFICHRVGVTAIIHDIGCIQTHGKRLPSIWDIKQDELKLEERVPCPVCQPDVQKLLKTSPASLVVETDRHWVSISETAQAMIKSLYTTRDGSKSLSSIASTAIMDAAEHNDEIYKAYTNVKIG